MPASPPTEFDPKSDIRSFVGGVPGVTFQTSTPVIVDAFSTVVTYNDGSPGTVRKKPGFELSEPLSCKSMTVAPSSVVRSLTHNSFPVAVSPAVK